MVSARDSMGIGMCLFGTSTCFQWINGILTMVHGRKFNGILNRLCGYGYEFCTGLFDGFNGDLMGSDGEFNVI